MSNKGRIVQKVEGGISVFSLVRDAVPSGGGGSKDKTRFAASVRRSEALRAARDRTSHTAKTGERNQVFLHNFTNLTSFESV